MNQVEAANTQARLVEFFADPENGAIRRKMDNKTIAKEFGCPVAAVTRARDAIRGLNGGLLVDLPLGAIVEDRTLQCRAVKGGFDPDTVERYMGVLKDGGKLPPVTVFEVGVDLKLVDGFQRYRAYKRSGLETIPCEVVEGTWEQAVLFAAQANESHGLVRSDEDRRRAVLLVLAEIPEYRHKSRREIALAAKVTDFLVRKMLKEGWIFAEKDNEGREFIRPGTAKEIEAAREAKAAQAEERKEPEILKPPAPKPDVPPPSEPESPEDEGDDEGEAPIPPRDDSTPALTPDEEIEQILKNCASYAVLSQPGREVQLLMLRRDVAIAYLTQEAREQFSKVFRFALRDVDQCYPRPKGAKRDGRTTELIAAVTKLVHPVKHAVCQGCGGDGCQACRGLGRI